MRRLTLGLVALTLACGSRTEAPTDGGYDLKVTSSHPDDVVVYLYNGSRRRLGRMDGLHSTRTWHLSTAQVRSGPQVMVCVGNYSPTNRQCYLTPRMTGGYPGEWGEPGTVLLTIQRGIGGIVAMLNG